MLATHHFNAYIDHYGHLYQKDKKHPGQYISEGISFLMKYGKLLKLGQEKKERLNSYYPLLQLDNHRKS